MHRSIKSETLYRKHRRADNKGVCAFCEKSEMAILKTHQYFRILKNRFPYSTWDSGKVADHLMLAPIRHLTSFYEMNHEEQKEYLQLTFEYEKKGYDFYTRASNNLGKSIAHVHAHLIKVTSKKFNFFLFLRHPYISLPL